ncbi:hypothetical protein JXB31_03380 [Candidatus Woesearchaeota archaeon]|nr:hypothetical protein [Candidatus Woesearchaeota archaeon]
MKRANALTSGNTLAARMALASNRTVTAGKALASNSTVTASKSPASGSSNRAVSSSDRAVYSDKALIMIPRLLSLLNRNEFSKTYGSFQRTFWLDKSDDFVNALPQFGTQSLALVYSYPFPGSIYYRKEKIKRWTLAAMDYWTRIQHSDGSFDEFYPNERGWAGPTGFLLYSMAQSYRLVGDSMSSSFKDRFLETCRKAAVFLGKYDEEGILANHHAMAFMPIYHAYDLLKDKRLLNYYRDKINYFYRLVSKEGWSLEYDGADLGYLSATVSFLAKLYKLNPDKKILETAEKSVGFLKYFVYPNNYYAGSMGSRQTLHFYPHGCEYFSSKIPIASVVADRMLAGLSEGKLVPPQIQADRYFLYRIPELLESYIDYGKRPAAKRPLMPYEESQFTRHFPHGRYYVRKGSDYYFIENMAKGGVIKIFDKDNRLVFNDNGIIGQMNSSTYTSQWVDKDYKTEVRDGQVVVQGKLNTVPEKVFSPYKGMLFRSVMLTVGANTYLSYKLKGMIRNLIIFGNKRSPVSFRRTVDFDDKNSQITVNDEICNNSKKPFKKLKIGDEFFVRYVPQSMYFQPIELELQGDYVPAKNLAGLRDGSRLRFTRTIDLRDGKVRKRYS